MKGGQRLSRTCRRRNNDILARTNDRPALVCGSVGLLNAAPNQSRTSGWNSSNIDAIRSTLLPPAPRRTRLVAPKAGEKSAMKHSITIAALLGCAFFPQLASAQSTDQSATAAPGATVTANPMVSSGPADTTTAAPLDQTTTATTSTTSGPWGLLGLLGLLGLIGLRGRTSTTTTREY